MSRQLKHVRTRAVVAAVQLPNVSDAELHASLTELRQLGKTLGFEVVATFTQQRPKLDSAAYFGVGKRDEIRRFVCNEPERERNADNPSADEGAEEELAAETRADPDTRRADVILVDHEISPMQARNLAHRRKPEPCVLGVRAQAIEGRADPFALRFGLWREVALGDRRAACDTCAPARAH